MTAKENDRVLAGRINNNGLIDVSFGALLLVMIPLCIIAAACWWIGLVQVSSSLVVGFIRTFMQLSLLGTMILRPIFLWGKMWLVIGYVLFMIVQASYEASSLTKYIFDGQFYCIFASLLTNATWVGFWRFVEFYDPRRSGILVTSFQSSECYSVTLLVLFHYHWMPSQI
jgi:hypothetical protein